MRNFLIALFVTAALPAMVMARPPEDDGLGDPDRGGRTEQVAQRQSGGEPRQRQEYRREPVAQPAVAAQVRVDATARPDRGWNGASAAARNNGGSRGGFEGNRNRRFDTPAAPLAQPPAVQQQQRSDADNRRRAFNRDAGQRGYDASADRRSFDRNGVDANQNGRRNLDRNGVDANQNGRRDFDRNDNRRDFDRNDNGRGFDRSNDGRRDWNNGNRDNRGWNGNRNGDNARNFDRNWRSNQRYDWQRYRGSNRSAFRLPRYAVPYGWNYGYRRFSVGAYLFAGLFAQNYWIGNPYDYRLPPVSWPYQWVRYYNDALLVDTRTGYVVDSIQDIFWY